MQPRIQLPAPLSTAALLVAAALTGCGSSDSTETQGPPAGGRLPEEFSVFISDRTTTGTDVEGNLQPYLYDFSTGEVRSVGGGLPNGKSVVYRGASVSPDGRWLWATVGNSIDYSTHVIDLDRNTTRTIALPSGGNQSEDGGGGPPSISFSADSSRVMILTSDDGSFQNATFSANADGSGLRRIQLGAKEVVEPRDWIGSSSRFLVTGYDETLSAEVLAIVDESGSISAPIQISTNFDTGIDDLSISADGSAIAALVVTFTAGGQETYEVVVYDLETSSTTEFAIDDVDFGEILINDTGEYVAIYTEDSSTGLADLRIGEVASGALEFATLPLVHAKSSNMDCDEIQWEPNGSRLAFTSSHRISDAIELTVASFGSTPMAIEPTPIPGSDVEEFSWSPNGRFLASIVESNEQLLVAFDADSTAAPIVVTDNTFSTNPRRFAWSPDGEHLIVAERLNLDGAESTVAYRASDFTPTGALGPAFNFGQLDEPPFLSGIAPLAFSRDGRHILWYPGPSSLGPDVLLSADLDDPTAPAIDIAANAPMGTMPPVEQFWLRR